MDLFIRLLSGSKEIMIYGVLPLSYMFQTVGDMAMIAFFGVSAQSRRRRGLRSDDDGSD